jgi:valyl-tRNA synthetase
MNPILITYYKDGSKIVSSFGSVLTEEEALKKVFSDEASTKDVERNVFIANPEGSLADYNSYSVVDKDNKVTVDDRMKLIDKKVEEIREVRNDLIQKLDIPFMIALEEKNEKKQQDIALFKNKLRDITQNLEFDKIDNLEDIFRYNPFNNVMFLHIINGGWDYTEPPKITIEPPDNEKYFGFQAEAVAFIKDGTVSKVEVTYNGCGYSRVPKVEIEGNANVVCMPIYFSQDVYTNGLKLA